MTERFIVDTAGTLIDMVTRNTYDYVSEVCPLLNDIDSENAHVKYSLSAYMVDLNNCKGKCSVLEEENEQLKKVLGAILLEVKQDISNTNQTGEIKVFINPNSFNLISEVLRKYGALKEWYG